MELEYIKRVLDQSQYTVCLLGVRASMDCGCMGYRQGDGHFDFELKYGYTPDEIFSSTYYQTRPQQFFKFYKNEVLNQLGMPDEAMRTLARMEKDGKLQMIVSRTVFSLPRRAGCRNVIELRGNVFENRCPHCNKRYPVKYMRSREGVPLCTKCNMPIRPMLSLVGDMMDNHKMSMATTEVAKAETLMIIGCSMGSQFASNMLAYFSGKQIILINDEEHPADRKADFVYHVKPRDILPLLYPTKEEITSVGV